MIRQLEEEHFFDPRYIALLPVQLEKKLKEWALLVTPVPVCLMRNLLVLEKWKRKVRRDLKMKATRKVRVRVASLKRIGESSG